jgi:23S rRNA pseudouridine1911/1915/1917 synthase
MNVIYEDKDVLVIDKPPGLNCDDFEKRVHRLDKDTSGVFLVAKNDEALKFLQKQFKDRQVEKKYVALVLGHMPAEKGEVETLLGRAPGDRRKQKVYSAQEPGAAGKREAKTRYRLLQRYLNYDLIEAEPLTGRKHQIRTHLRYLGHPIAGDKLYGFKNQSNPKNLQRQFLHAGFLKIALPNGEKKEFISELPEDLSKVLKDLEISN